MDIRFISTTIKNLEEMISAKEFRRDLLDRIGTIVINVPTLSQRAEDIEILTEYFLRKIAADSHRKSLSISRIAVDILLQHDWPGNVRELENTLSRAAALCSNDSIEMDNIVFIGSDQKMNRLSQRIIETKSVARLDDSQKSLIQNALIENNWNYTQTAQELGIGRTTLWRKVKKYDLKPESTVN
jgi:DNA-binding NtrC family response regulator